MSTASPATPATPASTAPERARGDSTFEASTFERSLGGSGLPRWIGWRRRALVLAALLGCLCVFWLARWGAAAPEVDATWAATSDGRLILQGSPLPALREHLGRAVIALSAPGAEPLPVDALLLHHSPRWQADDATRERQMLLQAHTAAWLAGGGLKLHFDNGEIVAVPARARGYGAMGLLFWPLAGLALLLYLFAVVVVLARPQQRNLLYAAAALAQAASLLWLALDSASGIAAPATALDPMLQLALDVCTGAAFVHALALHPRRLHAAAGIGGAAWTSALGAVLVLQGWQPAGLWWWQQALCLLFGIAALAVIDRSCRVEPNPYAVVLRRLAMVALGVLLLVTTAAAAAPLMPGIAHGVAAGAAIGWALFLATVLLLTPFLSRSRQLVREFALLAGVSTVATSVDLLFAAVFSVGPFTSLALAVFVALALYAGARQVIVSHMLGRNMLTTERTFEQLYRAARELQARPGSHARVLGALLCELFEPLELLTVERVPVSARTFGGGSSLVVPVRTDDEAALPSALVLRFAQHGQRLFTRDDARLADRVVEQLRRAVAYDLAVERGRHEERLRIAQDLHDDIGARLLTLMYQAQTPEMEDYIRHTLKDLKTLTRGLAAAEHRLSHAAAEWKADLTQRLTAAHVQLNWACTYDQDLRLSVVQWSALTRVLRELVSNCLYHGHATRVDVSLQLEGPLLSLQVADDGEGRDPGAWAHGLGLGGVRKRIKLLGGEVVWRENTPRGIVCDARVAEFTGRG